MDLRAGSRAAVMQSVFKYSLQQDIIFDMGIQEFKNVIDSRPQFFITNTTQTI